MGSHLAGVFLSLSTIRMWGYYLEYSLLVLVQDNICSGIELHFIGTLYPHYWTMLIKIRE